MTETPNVVDFEKWKEERLRPYQERYDAAIEVWHNCTRDLDVALDRFKQEPTNANDTLWRVAMKRCGKAITEKNRAKHKLRAQERKATVEFYFKYFKHSKNND